MSVFTHIHYHKVDGSPNQYAVLTLNRPKKAHAYHREMLCEIESYLLALQETSDVCALVLQSEGHRVFCSGADLQEMKTVTPMTALQLQSERIFALLEKLPCVTIAAIHGPAIAGGFEMTLACDLRVISSDANFSLPEVSLGLIPAAGGCVRLPHIIGITRSNSVILGGHVITAEEAITWGLANVMTEAPRTYALQWAQKLAHFDRTALCFAKRVLAVSEPHKSHLQAKIFEGILYHRKTE